MKLKITIFILVGILQFSNTLYGQLIKPIAGCPVNTSYTVEGGGGYCNGGSGVSISLSSSQVDAKYTLLLDGGSSGQPTKNGDGKRLVWNNITQAGTYTITGGMIYNYDDYCTKTMTGSVDVTIQPLPARYDVTGGGEYYIDATVQGVAIGLSDSQNGVNYQLKKDGSNYGSPKSGNGGTLNFGIKPTGNYTVEATRVSTGCTRTMRYTKSVTVLTSPLSYQVLGGGSYCEGINYGVIIALKSSQTDVIYYLQRNGVIIPSSKLYGNGAQLKWVNQLLTGTYEVVARDVESTDFRTMDGVATISINQSPTEFNMTGGGIYYIDQPTQGRAVGLSGSQSNVDYLLIKNGVDSGTPIRGNGSSISFGVQSEGTYEVKATNINTGCQLIFASSKVVTKLSSPLSYKVSGGGGYCAEKPGVTIKLEASEVGVTYHLRNDNVDVPNSEKNGTGSQLKWFNIQDVGEYTVAAIEDGKTRVRIMEDDALVTVLPAPNAIGDQQLTLSLTESNRSITPAGLQSGESLNWFQNESMVLEDANSYDMSGYYEGTYYYEVQTIGSNNCLSLTKSNLTVDVMTYFADDIDFEPQYNGNISAIQWNEQGGLDERLYTFKYDPMNRLTKADHMFMSSANNNAYDVNNLTYDFNGNIRTLNRWMDDNGAKKMDELTYDYANSGNLLYGVTDAAPGTYQSKGFKDGNSIGDDYTYDDNGNMIKDLNKGISSIQYNHMNLPVKITKDDGQYIKYIYDGAGTKLAQEVYNSNDVRQKRTDYIGEFIYESIGSNPLELKIIQHSEGRIVPNSISGDFEYQYTIKDHLGNNRLTFTSQPKTHVFNAYYEDAAFVTKDGADNANNMDLFVNMDNIIDANIHDATDEGTVYTKSQKLTGADGAMVGSILTIPVGKGDKINATVSAKYYGATGTQNLVGSVAGVLIGALTGNSTATNFEGVANSTTSGSDGSFIGALGNAVSNSEPMAFINLMFITEDATDVSEDRFSYGQITSASNDAHALLSLPEMYVAPANGYVIVYLSNESNYQTDVYFDDLNVTIIESNIIQTDDYYPFGLEMANGYKRLTNLKNNYLFNGVEKASDLDLEMYTTLFRLYDPAIGRFHQVDPLTDFMPGINPYQFGFDNPINFNDPTGLMPGFGGNWWGRTISYFKRISKRIFKGEKDAHGTHYSKKHGWSRNGGYGHEPSNVAKRKQNSIKPNDIGSVVGKFAKVPKFEFEGDDWQTNHRGTPKEWVEPVDKESPKPVNLIKPHRSGDKVAYNGIFVGTDLKNKNASTKDLYSASEALKKSKNLKVIIKIGTNFSWMSYPANTPYKSQPDKTYDQIMEMRANVIKDILINELGVSEDQIEIDSEPEYDAQNTKYFLNFENK